MSKAKEKRAARKAYEKKLTEQLPAHDARHVKRAFAELGFHQLRREYQVQCNAGQGEIFNRGFWRYLWNEFVPDVAPNATWNEAEDILRDFDNMLAKGNLHRQNLVDHILKLGRIGA